MTMINVIISKKIKFLSYLTIQRLNNIKYDSENTTLLDTRNICLMARDSCHDDVTENKSATGDVNDKVYIQPFWKTVMIPHLLCNVAI